MATIDYKEKYEQALKRAKSKIKDDKDHVLYEDDIIDIFPELKESEDGIRKALISFLKSPFVNENITDEKVAPWIAWLEKQGEQKLAWSEEDEERLQSCIKILQTSDGYDTINTKWLKNLKDRVQPQPKQEWNENDKEIWADISDMLWEGYKKTYSKLSWDEIRDWIKPKIESFNLRSQPQSYWKPSEEQMIAIDTAINVLGKGTLNGKQLIELQEQLKKLKGEEK